jgi:hypothetical protein
MNLPSLHGLLLFANTSYHARQSKRRSAIELDQCPSRKDSYNSIAIGALIQVKTPQEALFSVTCAVLTAFIKRRAMNKKKRQRYLVRVVPE